MHLDAAVLVLLRSLLAREVAHQGLLLGVSPSSPPLSAPSPHQDGSEEFPVLQTIIGIGDNTPVLESQQATQ